MLLIPTINTTHKISLFYNDWITIYKVHSTTYIIYIKALVFNLILKFSKRKYSQDHYLKEQLARYYAFLK